MKPAAKTPMIGPEQRQTTASTMLKFFMRKSIQAVKTIAGLWLYLQKVLKHGSLSVEIIMHNLDVGTKTSTAQK